MLSDVTQAGVRERQQELEVLCETAQGSWVERKDYLREALKQMWTYGQKNRNKMKRFGCVSILKYVKNMPDSFHPKKSKVKI